MTVELYPELDAIEIDEVITPYKGNYKILSDFEFVFDCPGKFEDADALFMRDNYYVVASHGLCRVGISAGTLVDGVTMFPDFECLLIWSIAHDVCCWASQETGNKIFEEIADEVCSEICKVQGAGFVLRNTVEIAVEAYKSYKNEANYVKDNI